MNMLGENRSLLAKVDDRQTIYGKGYVAGSTSAVFW